MQGFIIALIKEVVKALFGAVQLKSQDGAKPGAFEEKLKAQIKKDGWVK